MELKLQGVYKVTMTEYERGYGQRPMGTKFFDNEAEAKAFCKEYASGDEDTFYRADYVKVNQVDSILVRMYNYHMNLTLTTSTEWSDIESKLYNSMPPQLRNRKDVRRMVNNIYGEVRNLSKLELEHRRSPSRDVKIASDAMTAQIEKINKYIADLQMLITYGCLVLGK